jgi:AraC-like DNA-binding protein
MNAADANGLDQVAGAYLDRVELSIGGIDLVRFRDYAHSFPRHSHDFFTIGVFSTGNGRIHHRGTTWAADDGAILAVSPDEVHTAEPRRDRGWTYTAMYPSVDLFARAVGGEKTANTPFFSTPIFRDDDLARQIVDSQNALTRPAPALEAEVLLIDVLRQLGERHGVRPSARGRAATASRAVLIARDYLQEHFANPVKLAELASVCDTSPYHLVRSFRDALGMPPHAYLTQIRSNHARDLILRGVPVSTAAYRCGFADQSHLTRTFKRIFGVTPGAYVSASRRAAVRGN